MDRTELRRFAKIGAALRLAELRREVEEILRQFPELRGRSHGAAEANPTTPSRDRRRKLSRAALKNIRAAQKKRWAAWRKAKSKKAKTGEAGARS
jgi:hypothetical protein